jgi:IstB-like ATP binding protein
MEIVEDCHGNGSTLITSMLTVDKWHDVIGEPTFADAILDRRGSHETRQKSPKMNNVPNRPPLRGATVSHSNRCWPPP